jgi:Family of unknown function (DUF6698)
MHLSPYLFGHTVFQTRIALSSDTNRVSGQFDPIRFFWYIVKLLEEEVRDLMTWWNW